MLQLKPLPLQQSTADPDLLGRHSNTGLSQSLCGLWVMVRTRFVWDLQAKGKGEKERYTHLNAEVQRIAKRNKKAFLGDQCKEIKETIEWERLEISSRKLEIPREHFMWRWNGMDLTETEDIKKRWQEYTEKLCKKDLHNPDNHSGVVTHLEPDILECEIK